VCVESARLCVSRAETAAAGGSGAAAMQMMQPPLARGTQLAIAHTHPMVSPAMGRAPVQGAAHGSPGVLRPAPARSPAPLAHRSSHGH
jgi:hypothetical protein